MHRSTKYLVSIIVTGFILVATVRILRANGVEIGALLPHSLLVFMLALGTVLFLGNIIVTAAWMAMAERSGKPEVAKFAVRAVNWADVFFTAPGVYLTVISGQLLAESYGGFSTGWVVAAELWFAAAGVAWLVFLVPSQNKMIKLAQNKILDRQFYQILHRWYVWGIIATITPLISLAMIVTQPNF